MVDFHLIIPARFASSRLPKKLLKSIANKPLLQYVYERALEAGATSVTIATDHEEIFTAMSRIGAKVFMTSNVHDTGTDRIAETVDLLELPDDAIVVNLQGDEPLMPASLLCQVAEDLTQYPDAAIATLCEPIKTAEELFNASVTKVVCDAQGYALYFSRAALPWDRDRFPCKEISSDLHFRHLGLYAYRVSFLRAYRSLSVAPMEKLEKLEQLRALHHGFKIHVALANTYCPPGVDTEEDFQVVKNLIENEM